MAIGDTHRESQKYVVGVNRGDMKPPAEKDAKAANKFLGASSEHIETVEPEKIDKRQKVKRHFRRFWCCYLMAAIIFLAILLPILFLVIIPAIAQRIIDDNDLPVYSVAILDPKPDQFTFSLETALNIPAGLSVRSDPFPLRLFNRAVKPMLPYISVNMPGYNLKGNTKMHVTQHNTMLENKADWVKMITDAVHLERFTLSAKGFTVAHLGALKADVALDKDIELVGMDAFSGFAINSARLILPAEDDGTNLRGEAVLPNQSVITFALGNVTLNLKSKDLVLGYAQIQNFVIKPGNNTFALSGRLDIRKILQNLPEVISAQRDAIMTGEVELLATGNKTVYEGQQIPYYEQVLNGLTLTARVPILGVLIDTLKGLGGGNGSLWKNIGNIGNGGGSLSGLLDGL